ncbi:MAG: hypothetical protein ACYC7E_11165 [Armatimonadota bacterium]
MATLKFSDIALEDFKRLPRDVAGKLILRLASWARTPPPHEAHPQTVLPNAYAKETVVGGHPYQICFIFPHGPAEEFMVTCVCADFLFVEADEILPDDDVYTIDS